MTKTLVIAAAIVVAGALVGGAIVFVDLQNQPDVIQTTSAQDAWEYANGGWTCESSEGKPMTVDSLELFARTENEANVSDLFMENPITCTEPGS